VIPERWSIAFGESERALRRVPHPLHPRPGRWHPGSQQSLGMGDVRLVGAAALFER
jgi:hypothetical protein